MIHKLIREIRIDLQFNQYEWAEEMGTRQSNVSSWESGKRLPPRAAIKKMASMIPYEYRPQLYRAFMEAP
jgi:DNA-binding transcriptional regulator YiaG